MKKKQIQQAALACFTQNGFEGTSLAQIAEQVGLKKQSLYSHYKDKDAIFLDALRYTKEIELAFYDNYFKQLTATTVEATLHNFLLAMKQMFQDEPTQRFWLRMNFYPPQHLKYEVEQEVKEIYDAFNKIFGTLFEQWQSEKLLANIDPEIMLTAFSGITNAMIMDIVYDVEQAVIDTRIEARWLIFWRGIQP